MTHNSYFIGGGHMVEAIIAALRKDRRYQQSSIYVEETSNERLDYLVNKYHIKKSTSNFIPNESIDLLIIGVRPQDQLAQIFKTIEKRFLENTTIISIVAGLKIEQIEFFIKKEFPIVRIIPNTLTTTNHGYSGVSTNELVSINQVASFFETFGKVLYVDESYLDKITGFYPPNIIYHLLDAYIDAGVLAGLPRNIATQVAYDNCIGAIEFLNQENVLPKELLDRNNSPGGVGIRLAYELNRNNFAGSIQTAILAAVKRTNELGGEVNE